MKRNTLARLVLALCAAAALMLTGCGGGDNGVSQGLHDDLQMDHDELVAALEAEKAKVTAAMDRIGSAPDENGMGGSGLLADLAAEMATVAMLTQQIDGDGTDANPGLTAQLAAAMDRIGSAPDENGMGGSGLLADLAAEMATVTMLTQQIDGDGTDANPGLTAQLAAANARIELLLKGEDPGQLTPITGDASAAATAARTAATSAGEYADQAEMDDDNRATLQTGDANSVDHAKYARAQATTADTEAGKAETAATMAAAATTTADANKYMNMAEAAKTAAETAMGMAKTQAEEAKADSMVELKIDDKIKSVGETSIDADASRQEVTINDETSITGRLGDDHDPDTTVAQRLGVVGVRGNPDGSPDPYVAPEASVATRKLDIGRTLDDPDDEVRLMLVTTYAGTRTVKVYALPAGGTDVNSIKANTIQTEGFNTITLDDDDTFVDLESVGTFYFSGTALTPNDAVDGDGALQGSVVSGTSKAARVYSYMAVANGPTLYVILDETTNREDGITTYQYSPVNIYVALDMDGDNETDDVLVTAKIPVATEYEHIHFGVWAALGNADDEGEQQLSDLGIGFVQNFSGEGMTGADMPNNGKASYSGNWVAAIRAEDEDGDGDIALETGTATLGVDFKDAEITATLMGLATLEGDITGNTFSGDKASNITHGNLDGEADFEGEFSGAFYGTQAAEAGGVFDFTSEDTEGGEFRGAFGGDRTD